MLDARSIPIMQTYARYVDTFVVMEESARAHVGLNRHGCSRGNRGHYSCPWSTISFIVLISACGGLERHRCCRVFRFLSITPLSHDWVAFVDDDVYVPSCLASRLPLHASALFAPSKHVGMRGGWRWSLCGEKGRPDTEISLPAGYGFATRSFVSILRNHAMAMVRQCAATPAYNIDVALSFASWWSGVNLTAAFDWTDPRVHWMGGQRHLWKKSSWIFHKVRSASDFHMLHENRLHMCGVAHSMVKELINEQKAQTGYMRTNHFLSPSLREQPFDCQ